MGDNLIPISDEQAKLLQEIVGAIRGTGGYVELGDLPKDLLGLFIGDKVKVKRAENLLKLCDKAKKRLAEQKLRSRRL